MRYLKKQWIYAASLVLLLGAVFIFNYLQGAEQSVTLVAVDINPGMELIVNKRGLVDQVSLLNEDAKLLLSGKDLKNEDVYEALQIIFAKAEQQGYLDTESGKKWIWLSIVGVGEAAYAIDPQKITVQDKNYNVEVFSVNEQQWEKAKQEQLSLNKYIVKELAAEKGVPLNEEQLRSQSILSSLQQAGVDPQDLFDIEPERNMDKDPSANSAQSEPTGSAGTINNSGGVQGEHERVSDAPAQQQPDTSAVIAQEQPAAEKADKSPQAGSKVEVRKLKFEVKLAADGKVKLDYKNKDGKSEAVFERKAKQDEEKRQGQQAVTFAEQLIKQLDLNEQSDRKTVLSLLISALNMKQDEWLELEFEAEYSNGGKFKFELENPLKDQIKAEEKKKEQEKKEQEKANKKAKEQDKKKDKEKEKDKEIHKDKVKEQGEKQEKAKKPAKTGKKDNNDDDDDNDDD
ncbi:hypothetical protein YSY43_22370 [Paenibacillus sp. YSY-4.3]